MEIHSLSKFRPNGLGFLNLKREHPFDRFPLLYKNKVRREVWDLAKNNSGVSINFSTNSPFIELQWEVQRNFTMNHMPNSGIKGIDLYAKLNNIWQYVGTGIPEGKKNHSMVIQNMKQNIKEFKIYLPLYDGIEEIYIGLKKGSSLEATPNQGRKKPIVFYGTSITQGGCASRTGISHTNIISRKTNIDCLNFGFSGNGHLEKDVGNIISKINAKVFIIECMQNIDEKLLEERLIPLISLLRKKQKSPIVLITEPEFKNPFYKDNYFKKQLNKNNQLKKEYNKLKKRNVENIFLIDQPNAIGNDNEATVDGVHFNDLGFMRYANHLIENLKSFDLL